MCWRVLLPVVMFLEDRPIRLPDHPRNDAERHFHWAEMKYLNDHRNLHPITVDPLPFFCRLQGGEPIKNVIAQVIKTTVGRRWNQSGITHRGIVRVIPVAILFLLLFMRMTVWCDVTCQIPLIVEECCNIGNRGIKIWQKVVKVMILHGLL
jgi:hypothetical protein